MIKLNQGWQDIEAMPEDIFWAFVAVADEISRQERMALDRAKRKR